MKDTVQFVFTKRGKYDVYVIWHHAPPKELIARTLKMLKRIRNNFGDTRIAHMALAETAIETAFCCPKQAPKFACSSATATASTAGVIFFADSRCRRS